MSMYEKWLSKRSLFKYNTPSKEKIGSWASCTNQINHSKFSSNRSSHLYNNPSKEADSRNSSHQMNKNKAHERDERDFLEQIAIALQGNKDEMSSLASEIKDSMEKFVDLSREETKQSFSALMENVTKFQNDLFSSLCAKEMVVTELNDLKKAVNKKDSEIVHLQSKLEVTEKARGEELRQLTKAMSGEIKIPQEILTKKIEEISERTSQLYHSLNKCQEKIEKQNKNYQDLAISTPGSLKEMEKRMMKELKKIEVHPTTLLKMREAVENCVESSMLDVQNLLQQNMDLISMKTRSEIKDFMSQEQRKNLEACLMKHLKSISDQLEEINHMYGKEQHLQESILQAVTDSGLEKIKLSVEECKTAFEKEASLLRQTEQRLKICTDRLFSENCLHGSYPRGCDGQSLQSSSSKTDSISQIGTESGDGLRNCHRNRDYDHNQDRFGKDRKHCSDSYHVHQNTTSFPAPSEFSQHFTAGRQNFSSCHLQEPSRKAVVHETVENKRLTLQSKPDSFISSAPFKRPFHIPINPSPVATVKPQSRMKQTLPSDSRQGSDTLASQKNVHVENFRYDLRKRKMKDEPEFLHAVKEQKLENKKNSNGRKTISNINPEEKLQNSKSVTSRNCQVFHKNVNSYLRGEREPWPSLMQNKECNVINGRQYQKPFDASCSGCNYEKVPAYFMKKNKEHCISNERNQETIAPSEIGSGISSPACSVYSLTMKTPQRQISTALSSRIMGSFCQPMGGGNKVAKHSTLSTLLTDL